MSQPDPLPRILEHVVCVQQSDAGIGYQQELLYRCIHDRKHFRTLTTGHVIIMGRKTFDTLRGLLPQRTHVVLTRRPITSHTLPDSTTTTARHTSTQLHTPTEDKQNHSPTKLPCVDPELETSAAAQRMPHPLTVPFPSTLHYVNSLPSLMTWIQQRQVSHPTQRFFIIGGQELYQQTWAYTQSCHLTWVDEHAPLAADTFYPTLPDSFHEDTHTTRVEMSLNTQTQSICRLTFRTYHAVSSVKDVPSDIPGTRLKTPPSHRSPQ